MKDFKLRGGWLRIALSVPSVSARAPAKAAEPGNQISLVRRPTLSSPMEAPCLRAFEVRSYGTIKVKLFNTSFDRRRPSPHFREDATRCR